MKTTLILLTIIGIVYGELVKVKYPSTNPCMLLDVDATFDVTVSQDGQEKGTKSVTTNSQTSSNGTCETSVPILNIYSDGTKWTWLFSKKSDNVTVMVDMVFVFDPSKMFPNLGLSSSIRSMSLKESITLSKTSQSFVCMSQQQIEFKDVSLDNKTSISAMLTMEQLHVQAFEVSAGKFSTQNEVCDGDVGSSAASDSSTNPSTSDQSTTENPTTEGSTSEKSTTEGSTTAGSTTEGSTTESPTTEGTTTPAPPDNTYTVKDGNDTCLMMRAQIVLRVQYVKKDNSTALSNPIPVPADATSDGTCPSNSSESNATLLITFDDDDTIEFVFSDVDGTAMITEVSIGVVQDLNRFPDAKSPSKKLTMTVEGLKVAQTKDDTYYLCHSGDTITFDDKNSTLELIEEQIQAFNLKGDNFTGDGSECSADLSTTPTPTSGPTTTPKPGPPVNNFTVHEGDVICIVMQASMELSIDYMNKNNKSMTAQVTIPEIPKGSITGACNGPNATMQTLTFTFFSDWSITMIFSLDGSQMLAADEDKTYDLANITITYVLDSHFPNASDAGKTVTVNATNKDMFKTSQQGSYKCTSNVTINSDQDKVNLTTSNFQYKAFQTGNSTTFSDNGLTECPADTETNSIVPIAVGAALAGLVVIVLIAYLIGRRKSRRSGYESV